ncbi:MAG TPA: tetratricopeptide repeat protein [Flavobacteriaceae bacterium]|nr:tetratricopeptide repeat protein [Flavobacteriaceae bacterium]
MEIKIGQKAKKYFYLVLLLLPFALYWNALDNEYAIDDNLIVDGVGKIEDGIASFGRIFTSTYTTDGEQSFGYRPIATFSFAIEKQFFNGLPAFQKETEKLANNKLTQANISHFINVLTYALTCCLLFYFLLQILPGRNLVLPFLIGLIFLFLPIHTEPVNNIKSRDVLLMVFFILCALVFYIKFAKKANFWYILPGMLCIILALYSKKSAVALIGIIPVVLYFVGANFRRIAWAFFSVLLIFVIAVLLKKNLLSENSVRNIKYFENPLLYEGSFLNRVAMGFYCAVFYLKMMIFPKEFSFYYGYKQIPMVTWGFYQVWLGVLVFVPLAIYGFIRFLKRDLFGLGVVIWLGVMLGLINVAFPIVGIVGERFAFLFSIGFSIAVGTLLIRVFGILEEKKKNYVRIPVLFYVVMGVIFLSYAVKIMNRNPDWENYLTLYTADIDHLKNSAKANVLTANELRNTVSEDMNLYKKRVVLTNIVDYYKNALAVAPDYAAALNNLSYIYMKYLGKYEEAIPLLKKAEEENKQQVVSNLAFAYFKTGQYSKAVPYLIESVKMYPQLEMSYNNLFQIAQNEKFRPKVESELARISPDFEGTYAVFSIKMGNYFITKQDTAQALYYYRKAMVLDPQNNALLEFVGKMESLDQNPK